MITIEDILTDDFKKEIIKLILKIWQTHLSEYLDNLKI
jgi:hypothetical protein